MKLYWAFRGKLQLKFPKRIDLWLANFRKHTSLLKLEKTLKHLPRCKKAENLKKLYIIIK